VSRIAAVLEISRAGGVVNGDTVIGDPDGNPDVIGKTD
jgi:hypothetical protein